MKILIPFICCLLIAAIQLQAQKKEPFKWYISWTVTSSETYSEESAGNVGVLKDTYKVHSSKQINHSGSEVIQPPQTPDLSGSIGISVENGDSLVSYQQSGSYSYNYYEEATDNLGLVQKITIAASGAPAEVPYIEFEYHPDEKVGGINAGSWFNVTSDKNVLARSDEGGMKNINSQDNSQEHFTISNPGDKITKTKDGYVITGTIKEDTSYFDEGSGLDGVAHGKEKVERHSVITFHVTITDKPPQYDAILEVVNGDSYDNWLPQGAPAGSPGAKGNSITFDVYLVDKDKPDVRLTDKKFDVDYTLSDVSKEPGYCNNYPLNNANGDPDIIFDSIIAKNTNFIYKQDEVRSKELHGDDMAIKVSSYDYGSYAKLQASVILENGAMITAHFKDDKKTIITLPKDDNNNHIADEWEKQNNIYSKNYSADWDDEQQDGNKNNGDGLTLYEEYRGIMANGQHKRLDVNKKELFVVNKIGDLIKEGLKAMAQAAGINVIELDPGEVKAVDKQKNVVNFNFSQYHGGNQSAILCTTHDFTKPDDIDKQQSTIDPNSIFGFLAANAVDENNNPVVHSPKDALEYRLNKIKAVSENADEIKQNVSHELAHGCGVKHHGGPDYTASWKKIKQQSVGHDKIIVIDNNGQPVESNSPLYPKDDDDIVDITGNKIQCTASGDITCFMIYNRVYEYTMIKALNPNIQDASIYTIKLTPFGLHEKTDHNYSSLNTFAFCTSNNGSNNKTYGDAAVGNCMSQFKIKDW